MDSSNQEGEEKKQITEGRTFPVPFSLREIKDEFPNFKTMFENKLWSIQFV